MIKKSILIGYKDTSSPYHSLNSDVVSTYELTIKTTWLGLIKTIKKINIDIKIYQDLKETLSKWDKLIKECEILNE